MEVASRSGNANIKNGLWILLSKKNSIWDMKERMKKERMTQTTINEAVKDRNVVNHDVSCMTYAED